MLFVPEHVFRGLDPALDGAAHDRSRDEAAGLPLTIAFLRHFGVPRGTLFEYAYIAQKLAVGADEALISGGGISQERFYRLLAAHLNVPFIDAFVPLAQSACRRRCAQSGVAPLAPNAAGLGYILAPRGPALGALLRHVTPGSAAPPQFAVTTPAHLSRLALACQSRKIADEASLQLQSERPDLSALDGIGKSEVALLSGIAGALTVGAFAAPFAALVFVSTLLALVFGAAVFLRLCAVCANVTERPRHVRPLGDAELPVYSLVLPVHREKKVVRKLVAAIEALDYPAAKLDVKIVTEAGDAETLGALRDARLPAYCEVIIAPPGKPQTKPRALNIALPFCRGSLLVIYDAEDEPQPAQLREAAAAFADASDNVVCLQARLSIDNCADSWLTAMFAMEYAALFDVINPGLGELNLQFPLGGTSNHFRVEALRGIGGWDAWNVTEDADLGIRLARYGYHIGVINSTTFEEAPAELRAWRLQRQRWLKGFMQTLITHCREPRKLVREAGAGGAASALILLAGPVLGALFGPVLFAVTIAQIASGELLAPPDIASLVANVAALTLFACGVVSCLWPLLLGAKRRGLWRAARWLPLLPLYYGLMSVAGWGALAELLRSPFSWNKTEHGLARSSSRKRTKPFTGS